MLEDVLSGLSQVPALTGILVVTHEPAVSALATRFGAETVPEPENCGYTAAVLRATEVLGLRGTPAMLVIPGDVPALSPDEIALILRASAPAPSVVLVPSRDERGTNAALVAPPGALPLQFGEPSFQRHVARARELGLAVEILRLAGLSLDLDTPEDVEFFLRTPSPTRAYELLRNSRAIT